VKRIHISAVKVPALRDIVGLVTFLALCFGASVLGGWVTAPALRGWYADLAKPDWMPPGWVFGPVWTLLYALIAVSGWTIWREGRSRLAVLLFLLQLALNAAWPWVFFGLQRPDWAFYTILALVFSLAATIVVFYRLRRRAALLLVPYLAWVLFAAALNLAIWRLNP
jgi:tryptophan-rich sensory protein